MSLKYAIPLRAWKDKGEMNAAGIKEYGLKFAGEMRWEEGKLTKSSRSECEDVIRQPPLRAVSS